MTAPWLQTRTGRAFPLIDPTPEDVRWPDVIYALAHTNRFNGHVGTYSVAQHSCLVADQLPHDIKLYGLLHDAHEAYTGDLTTPVKSFFYDEGLWQLENLISHSDCAIHIAADLEYPVPDTVAEFVKLADMRAIMTERRDLMCKPPRSWGEEYERVVPLPEKLIKWTPHQAIARFALALTDAGLQCTFVSQR